MSHEPDNHRCPECNRIERFGHWFNCSLDDRPVPKLAGCPGLLEGEDGPCCDGQFEEPQYCPECEHLSSAHNVGTGCLHQSACGCYCPCLAGG